MAPSVRYITTFELIFHATPLATTHQAERQLGILYLSSFPLCPLLVILPHSSSFFLLLPLPWGVLSGRFSAAIPLRSWGVGPWVAPGPPPPPVLLVLSYLSLFFLKLKCMSQSVVARGNIISTIFQQLLR